MYISGLELLLVKKSPFMKNGFLILLLLLFPSNYLSAQPTRLTSLDAYIQNGLDSWELPGLALGIIKDGEIILAKGYGVQKAGDSHSVNPETLFAIGSNTKAFTATGLGMLMADHQLHWDDRVVNHLPNFLLHDPYTTREIRIRDLLCHRSGYGLWAGDLVFWGSNYSREEVVQRMRYLEPSFGFRSRYAYSNQMFILAGAVLEAAANTSWEQFMVDRIFTPLNMSRTLPGGAAISEVENVATPHSRILGQIIPIDHRPIDNAAPAGAIYSSVDDMLKWLRFQLDEGVVNEEQLIPTEILRETHTPQIFRGGYPISEEENPRSHFQAYGLGWGIHDYANHVIISHTGGVDGFFSLSGIIPQLDLGVVILTNNDQNAFYRALFNYILDIYLELPEVDWSEKFLLDRNLEGSNTDRLRALNTQPNLALEAYAGTYENQHYGLAEVTYNPDSGLRLHLKAHDGLQGPLEHWHYDTFEATWVDPYWQTSLVPFALNEYGKATSFSIKVREDFIDTLTYTFTRISD